MYHNFIGIDIGKFEIAIAVDGIKAVKVYKNEESDLKKLYQEYKIFLKKGLVVLETTGGYEKIVIDFLLSKKIAVHRANTRIVKNFIRSIGKFAKSDKIDATYLAKYGKERHEQLALYEPISSNGSELVQINNRIHELKLDLVREKNRLQAPDNQFIKKSLEISISNFELEIKRLQEILDKMIMENQEINCKINKIKEVAGIGKVTAISLLLSLPELGTISHKAIASLAGVAPHPNESGSKVGYRKTIGGRRHLRPILYLAALGASKSHSKLGDWYRNLVARGKKPIVALIALARKIVVLANAKLRDLKQEREENKLKQDLSFKTQINPA